MQDFSFSIDFVAALIVLAMGMLFFILWKWGQTFHAPHLKFSDLKNLKSARDKTKKIYRDYPYHFLLAAIGSFVLAFVDPHYYTEKTEKEHLHVPQKQANIPSEGIAIYFVLDRSGSMSEKVNAYVDGKRVSITKVDLLKKVTQEFIEGNPKMGLSGRPNDLLGMIFFARTAEIEAPLTLDHQEILKKLDTFTNVTDENQDGTAIGYAIYKAANLITATKHYAEELSGEGKPAYTIKNNIIILVTDGFQSPSPLDQENKLRNVELVDAADYARAHDIRLYIINVDPRMGLEEFALNRKLMKQIAELTRGKFFLVDSDANLGKIYTEIDRLEKSVIPAKEEFANPSKSQLPHLYNRISFYPWLIAIGMLCLMISIFLEGVFMRKVP